MLKEQNNIEMIMSLLEEKNNHLQMFLDISISERKSFKARNFENIESLYRIRENILESIRDMDQRIQKYSIGLTPDAMSTADQDKVRILMQTRQNLVNQIMSQDLVMLSCVENEKSTMIKKMTSLRNGRRLLKAYRFMPDIVE